MAFPIEEGSGIPESTAAVPESYLKIAHAKNMGAILRAIADAPDGVMFNCTAGKDRTGVVSALLLCGVSQEDVIRNYMNTKSCMKAQLQLIAQKHPEIDIHVITPYESYTADFLQHLLCDYASTEEFFSSLGIQEAD